MRIAVLTTQTPHHAYFVSALRPALVLCETQFAPPHYATAHTYETERDDFERLTWFGGEDCKLSHFSETVFLENINDGASLLRGFDLAICFGTRILRAPLIKTCEMLNLHGGDPEHYRGLDTHLWAIWHRDFAALKTCLHRLDETIDGGDIISIESVPVHRGMTLHKLRKANTELCIRLVNSALANGIKSRPQTGVGRYYSAMPADLKASCTSRFARYTDRLP